MRFPKRNFYFAVSLLALVFLFFTVVRADNWGDATEPFPGGNPAAPLDTSDLEQTKSGAISIGTDSKIKIENGTNPGGGILFNTEGSPNGQIFWNGEHFIVREGDIIVPLVGGGGGSGLPLGALGYTARHDGTVWTADNFLFNDGEKIGIGTITPGEKLEVAGNIKVTGTGQSFEFSYTGVNENGWQNPRCDCDLIDNVGDCNSPTYESTRHGGDNGGDICYDRYTQAGNKSAKFAFTNNVAFEGGMGFFVGGATIGDLNNDPAKKVALNLISGGANGWYSVENNFGTLQFLCGGSAACNVANTPRLALGQDGAVKINSLLNCNTIDTDVNGILKCGLDEGGGVSGVSQIVAGSNVTISPVDGTGVVTINATGGPGGGVSSINTGTGAITLTGEGGISVGSAVNNTILISGSGFVSNVTAGAGLSGGGPGPSVSLGIDMGAIGSCTDATNHKIYWNGTKLACGTDRGGDVAGNVIDTLSDTLAVGNDADGQNAVNFGRLAIGLSSPDTPTYRITTAGGGIKAVANVASQPAGYFNNDNANGYALVTDKGNVGIGTTAPRSQLEVKGTSFATVGITAANNNDANLLLLESPTGAAYGGFVIYAGGSDFLKIGTMENGTPVPAISIKKNTGNVGISGGIYKADGTTKFFSECAIGSSIRIINANGTVECDGGGDGGQWTSDGINVHNNNSGSVGIGTGTNNPAAKLEVSGGVKVTGGDLVVSGNILAQNNLQVTNINSIAAIAGRLEIGGDTKFSKNVDIGALVPVYNFSERELGNKTPRCTCDTGNGEECASVDPSARHNGNDNFCYDRWHSLEPLPNGTDWSNKYVRSVVNNGGNLFIAQKVGIGIAPSTYTLDVNGSINASSYYLNGLPFTGGGNTSGWVRDGPTVYLVTPSDNVVMFALDNTTPVNKFSINGSNYITGGNVGIGTNTPAAKLSVSRGYSTTNLISNAFLNIAAGGASPNLAQIWWGDNTGWKLNFGTRDASNNFVPRVTFNDTGNVGIGTTNPGYLLDVNGKTNATELCIGGVCKNTWPSGSSQWTTNGNDIYNGNSGNVGIGTTNPTAKLNVLGGFFLKNANNYDVVKIDMTQNRARLRLGDAFAATRILFEADGDSFIHTGRFGIGTATPSERLEVNGNVLIQSGGLKIDGPFATKVSETRFSYTLGSENILLCNPLNSDVNLTLPSGSGLDGRQYTIRHSGSSLHCVVSGVNGNGNLSPGDSITVVRYSGNWYQISDAF